ncbi:MAG: hypothetical protein RL477_326 [Pseudomonadota bacterium]|jgi:hypothetical protein
MRRMTRRWLIGAGWLSLIAAMLPWGAARRARADVPRPGPGPGTDTGAGAGTVIVNGWVLRGDDGIGTVDDR